MTLLLRHLCLSFYSLGFIFLTFLAVILIADLIQYSEHHCSSIFRSDHRVYRLLGMAMCFYNPSLVLLIHYWYYLMRKCLEIVLERRDVQESERESFSGCDEGYSLC